MNPLILPFDDQSGEVRVLSFLDGDEPRVEFWDSTKESGFDFSVEEVEELRIWLQNWLMTEGWIDDSNDDLPAEERAIQDPNRYAGQLNFDF